MTAETLPTLESLMRAAIVERSWDDVIAMIEANWAALTQNHRALLVDAVNALPEEVLSANPRLSAARTYANYLPVNGDVRPMRFRHAPSAPHGGLLDALADLTSRSVSARFEGQLSQAVAHVRKALAAMATASDADLAALRPVIPDIRVQWAITLQLAGELVDANRTYERTFDEALAVKNCRIATKSAGSIALNYALAGSLSAAEQWLRREPGLAETNASSVTDVSVDTVRTTGELARALLAANDLRFDEAAAALRAAPPAEVDRETWALRLYVESVLARVTGRASTQLLTVSTTLSSQPELHRTAGLNGWLATTATAELQLALGDVAAAHETILNLGVYEPLTEVDPARVLRAWIALRRGDPRRTILTAGPGLTQPLTSPRVKAELLVALSAACLALNQHDNARRHFAAAVDILVPERLPVVLLRLSPDERSTLLAEHSHAFETRVLAALDALENVVTAPITVTLTKREKVVLRHIVQGLRPSEIATAEHLSINTIKGQVRSLYRKLGVTDREGALNAALAAPHLLA